LICTVSAQLSGTWTSGAHEVHICQHELTITASYDGGAGSLYGNIVNSDDASGTFIEAGDYFGSFTLITPNPSEAILIFRGPSERQWTLTKQTSAADHRCPQGELGGVYKYIQDDVHLFVCSHNGAVFGSYYDDNNQPFVAIYGHTDGKAAGLRFNYVDGSAKGICALTQTTTRLIDQSWEAARPNVSYESLGLRGNIELANKISSVQDWNKCLAAQARITNAPQECPQCQAGPTINEVHVKFADIFNGLQN